MAVTTRTSFPSKYKYVSGQLKDGKRYWNLQMPGYCQKRYETEREAAIAIDMILIAQKLEPVNILKRKL